MRIDVLTLFPGIVQAYCAESIIRRAQEQGQVQLALHNVRDFAHDRHRSVDDVPYGGGPGMVMKPEPIFEALDTLELWHAFKIHVSPQGVPLTHRVAAGLAAHRHLVLLCGHYEGVDQRVLDEMDAEISVGDYVLSNGALAAMVVIDVVARLLPGVLGNAESACSDSFADGLLEYAQYTRPAEFRGRQVPDVLLSGNHAAIAAWRRAQALARTRDRRPDLLEEMDD
jgi:tRNA (guanine37-N1)-methyltransferase